MTLQRLKQLGCDTQSGVRRCMDNEAFYLMLVDKGLASNDPEKLKNALDLGDLDTAFALSHSMKGVYGNLSLTPLFNLLSELTELLRARTQMDYGPYMQKLEALLRSFKAAE